MLFINEFSPFTIPNHSSPISMSVQSLKKIRQKILKLEIGNEALMDGRTYQGTVHYELHPTVLAVVCKFQPTMSCWVY